MARTKRDTRTVTLTIEEVAALLSAGALSFIDVGLGEPSGDVASPRAVKLLATVERKLQRFATKTKAPPTVDQFARSFRTSNRSVAAWQKYTARLLAVSK